MKWRNLTIAQRHKCTLSILESTHDGPILKVTRFFIFAALYITRFYTGPSKSPHLHGRDKLDVEYTNSRSTAVEWLILLKLALPFAILLWLEQKSALPSRWIVDAIYVLIALQLFNLVAAILYYGLFKQSEGSASKIKSKARVVILALLNFLELVSLYAVFYRVSTSWSQFLDSKSSTISGVDAFYFSAVTSLTIGFGDIVPTTPQLRSLVVSQGLLSVFVLTILLGRIIGSLPHVQEIHGHDNDLN